MWDVGIIGDALGGLGARAGSMSTGWAGMARAACYYPPDRGRHGKPDRDFHPERVRRALAPSKGPSGEGRLKVVTESSKIEKGDEFLNDIILLLPYCEAMSEKRDGYHEVLIDDERIAGITVRGLPILRLSLMVRFL
jgi:hypothetical protein